MSKRKHAEEDRKDEPKRVELDTSHPKTWSHYQKEIRGRLELALDDVAGFTRDLVNIVGGYAAQTEVQHAYDMGRKTQAIAMAHRYSWEHPVPGVRVGILTQSTGTLGYLKRKPTTPSRTGEQRMLLDSHSGPVAIEVYCYGAPVRLKVRVDTKGKGSYERWMGYEVQNDVWIFEHPLELQTGKTGWIVIPFIQRRVPLELATGKMGWVVSPAAVHAPHVNVATDDAHCVNIFTECKGKCKQHTIGDFPVSVCYS